MIEVNNFKQIKSLLEFAPKRKTIIWVWVCMRSKDNDEHIERTIKSFHIQSMEDFDKREQEIIDLCKQHQCRAYICINPKPVLNVLFSLQSIVMENIRNEVNGGSSMLLKGMLDSAVMKSGSNGEKFWIIDVDTQDPVEIQLAYNTINYAASGHPEGNIIKAIDTAHGCHFITYPFDTRVLNHMDVPAELKKEGLTLLYCYLNR